MGFLDFLKRSKKQKEIRSIISNYYGGDFRWFVYNYASSIYDIVEVRTAIEFIANAISTVPIWHKRIGKDGNVEYLENSSTQRVLNYQSNPLQNGSQFIKNLVKGLMIESYIEDGAQKAEEGIYGKSITDPCLGWEKTEKLIYDLADLL